MKSIRQKKILELLGNENIGTQKELADALIREGFKVTQATVSRDIKELNLIKVSSGANTYKYAPPKEAITVSEKKLEFIIKEFLLTVDFSENIIIIKTAPGNANVVAAVLDDFRWPEIIGTVAGDDTIMIIVKPKDKTEEIVEKIRHYMI